MKQSEYMMAIFERLGNKQEIICQDCGAESKIGHAIINHDNETIKIVCNDCFVKNYMVKDRLTFSGIGKGQDAGLSGGGIDGAQ